ncbi:hypothetical protein HYH03_004394 [Edaphochlamys debaryana]|uniref:phytol kinase n=1 Tax=Edaphochlamys debaryana TaxID=47281 RepID=A0A835Y7F4_9CHLO|nr:hypothetical protein HYH03_004394 [Edaphochlamys debaryana]|eukprot:KAG2497655.1 hypothetical protein HYH03_004394 [Edaphochlamys debaryana]
MPRSSWWRDAASTLSNEQAARALALQDTLFKTRALSAAARQAAAASAALRGSPAAAAATASSARLRLRAAQQAAALMKLLGVLANLAKAKQRQGLVISLLAALRESSLLSHLGRLLLLLPPPPGEEPVPQALLTAHRDACLELCRAVSLTSSAASLLGGDPERHVRPALGPCAGHALLTLGSAALAASDLGPCGLPYSPVPLVPEQGGAPYPCVSGVVFFYGAVEMKIDRLRPRPTVHPRAAIRLMLRALKLCGASARAKLPGAVRRGPQGMLSVDVSLGGSRRAGLQDFKLLLPPAEVGELSYHALSTLLFTVRRWPAAWVAEAAAGWAPLVTSVVHTLPAAGAKMDLWLSALPPLLADAGAPLLDKQGKSGAVALTGLMQRPSPEHFTSSLLPELSRIAQKAAQCAHSEPAWVEAAPVLSAFATTFLRAYANAIGLSGREDTAVGSGPDAGGGVRGLGGAPPLPGASSGRRAQRAAPGPGGSAEGPAPAPGHRLASTVGLHFLVEECGAVRLLGALLDLAPLPGALQALPMVTLGGLANCYPRLYRYAEIAPVVLGAGLGTAVWRPPALRAFARLLKPSYPDLGLIMEAVAGAMERPEQLSLGPLPETVAEMAAEAERLAALKAEAWALLTACANPACANLAGDSEAGLQLKRCRGCAQASYCSGECQAAHWKAGHKAVCVAEGG